jgi:hypothetical protein
MSEKKQRVNHDSAWKDILEAYFKEFMEFFLSRNRTEN